MGFFRALVRVITNPPALRCRLSHSSAVEIKIPVPWGHIAARHWNAGASHEPVLCLHGWKDNAASFDKLMPIMVEKLPNHQFLCFDFPGHGFSSSYPLGFDYRFHDSYLWILRILRHFKWEKAHIWGHSLGAMMGFTFGASHPNHVIRLVAIEALTPFVWKPEQLIDMAQEVTSHKLRMDEKIINNEFKTFTKDEAFQNLKQSHLGGISAEACEILLTRGLTEYPEGSKKYKFSHDMRVQYLHLTSYSDKHIMLLAKVLKHPFLHIRAQNGIKSMTELLWDSITGWIKEDNPGPVIFSKVPDSGHHVLLTHGEDVANHILEFMAKSPSFSLKSN